jgi:predicted Fe-Mo cluster-binding NifX family protein
MKYAIPVYAGRLSAHFGQSEEFMLIDVDSQGKVIAKETMSVEPHNCGGTPILLARKGVQVVLAGGMGMGPRMAFERQNIRVVLGVTETDPEKATLGHVKGTLVSGQNVCDHGDSVCDHSGHHSSSPHN